MFLNADKIINSIKVARRKFRKGKLKDEVKNVVHISFWQTDEKSPKINKSKLIEIAKNGDPRPNQKKHPLGIVLNNYICKNGGSYDPIFDAKIRKLAPHWFANHVKMNKDKIFEMAKNGEPRPNAKNSLGSVFRNYMNKSNSSYDPIFTEKIRKLAPHWFTNQVELNKLKLVQMAKKGVGRPTKSKSPLGHLLCNYTNQNNQCFDSSFNKTIRELAPSWFVVTKDVNKQKLIDIAKKGENRPNQKKNPLGGLLSSYICKKSLSYDPVFDKKIRKLAPHWFKSKSEIASQKKQILIAMARGGEPRPHSKKHPLGAVFNNYISKGIGGCHDPVFTKKIRKLAPHWFRKK